MPGTGRTGTKRKSKAPVPKPPRGSGLNPSGLPANDQLNRPSERLRDPDHMFNPHDSPPRFDIGDDGNFDVGALYGRDALPDLSTNSRASGSRPNSNPYNVTGLPLARWTRDAPDGGLQLVAAFKPTDPSVRRMGEIPSSDIVHTTGPARTVRRVSRQVSMPSTPYVVPQALGAEASSTVAAETPAPAPQASSSSQGSSQSQVVTITDEVREQILSTAKREIVASLFTRDAMSQTSDDRKRLVRQAIMNAVPRFCSLNTSFNSVVNKAQCRPVSQALTSARGKVIDIARSGVPHAYELYRPSHHTTELSPVQYRVHIATTLTQSLAFMHSHHFDAGGNLHIHQHFNHPFIKHIVIRFVWYFGYEIFLGDSPLEALDYVIAMGGAAVNCVLLEQRMYSPSVDPFTGLAHFNKFIEILDTLAALEGEDKAALEAFKLDIFEVGPSQKRTQQAEEW